MSFAEIAVFHHLLNCAVRSEQKAEALGCKVGFCPDMTGNRLAAAMGKSRESIHRALRALACHGKARRRFITRTRDGIMVHNFDGSGAVEVPGEVAVKQASPDHSRPEYRPGVAVKQAAGGCDPGQDNRRDVGDVGDVSPTGQLSLAREPAAVEKLPANPQKFVAFWYDSTPERDFAVRFAPEPGFVAFVELEAARLSWSRSPQELAQFALGSLARFVATYSKRDGRNRTRGKRIGPRRLTEELIAWVRSDLGDQAKRDATKHNTQAERVDDSIRQLGQGGDEDWKYQASEAIAACPRDHERDREKLGHHWACPDKCGWMEVIRVEVEEPV